MENNNSILLHSGTNEVEIVEFGIQNSALGINVIKVKEIINAVEPVYIPMSSPYLKGIIQLRGDVIPVIDLGGYLNFKPSSNPKDDKYIVTEFNKSVYAFHVHSVSRIHRLSWEQIDKPTDVYQGSNNSITGIVRIDGRMILLLDFERIVYEISPEMVAPDSIGDYMDTRDKNVRIVIAEDSQVLRTLLKEYLPKLGYKNLTFFQDGRQAWEYLGSIVEKHGTNYSEAVNLLITDIEMPQMDGHFLTKSVKEHTILKKLPVVIFSSLITERLKHKGTLVGADAQVSKPEYDQLAHIINKYAL